MLDHYKKALKTSEEKRQTEQEQINKQLKELEERLAERISKQINNRDKEIMDSIRQSQKHNQQLRKNLLVESTDRFGRPLLLLNNMEWFDLPLTETPYNGTIEIWELYNVTPDTHPIHLHLVQFQILNRAPITVDKKGNIINVGKAKKPDPNEMGWKDTIRANPGEVTRIITRFGPFTGTYLWHCHILEHEDHDMMRPYEVLQNHDFDPCIFIPGECSSDSFIQCCHEGDINFKCKKCHPKE